MKLDHQTLDIFNHVPPRVTAILARDEALATVLANAGDDWRAAANKSLAVFIASHPEFIGEEFRLWALSFGLPKPHHHNAWGGVLAGAAKQGLIHCTGKTRNMKTLRSHARRSLVWARGKEPG